MQKPHVFTQNRVRKGAGRTKGGIFCLFSVDNTVDN